MILTKMYFSSRKTFYFKKYLNRNKKQLNIDNLTPKTVISEILLISKTYVELNSSRPEWFFVCFHHCTSVALSVS